MIKKIASAILVFNLYSWVTTTELIPIGHMPIKVMTEMSKALFVNKLAVINDNTCMIRKRTGTIVKARYLYKRAALKFNK